MANQRVSGVVLVPVCPRSSFFSFFFPDGKHLAVWVSEVMWTRPYFVCGPLVTSRGFRGRRRFDSALLKADFRGFVMKDFYKPNLSPKWCREGGCNDCEVLINCRYSEDEFYANGKVRETCQKWFQERRILLPNVQARKRVREK